jgi:hypothetical protein
VDKGMKREAAEKLTALYQTDMGKRAASVVVPF